MHGKRGMAKSNVQHSLSMILQSNLEEVAVAYGERPGGLVEIDRLPTALGAGPIEVVDQVAKPFLPNETVTGTTRRVLFFAPTRRPTWLFGLPPAAETCNHGIFSEASTRCIGQIAGRPSQRVRIAAHRAMASYANWAAHAAQQLLIQPTSKSLNVDAGIDAADSLAEGSSYRPGRATASTDD